MFLSKKILFVILLLVTGISLRTRDFVIESRNHRVLIQTLDLSQSQSSLVNADELKTRQVGQWTAVIFSSSCSLAVFCFSVFQAQCVCRVCVCVSTDMQHLYGTSKVCLFDTLTIWWIVRVSRGTIVDIHDRLVFGQTKTDSLRESRWRSASSLASLRHWLFDEMIFYFSSASLLAQ